MHEESGAWFHPFWYRQSSGAGAQTDLQQDPRYGNSVKAATKQVDSTNRENEPGSVKRVC